MGVEGRKEFLESVVWNVTTVAIKIKDQWVKATVSGTYKRSANQVQIKYQDICDRSFYKAYHLDDTKHIRMNPDTLCTSCSGTGSHSEGEVVGAILDVPIPKVIAQMIASFLGPVDCRTCGATGTCADVSRY